LFVRLVGILGPISPKPDAPELKIEDCKLNIGGCRFALSFLKLIRRRRTLNIQYSIVTS
jgi:hypothetical protein